MRLADAAVAKVCGQSVNTVPAHISAHVCPYKVVEGTALTALSVHTFQVEEGDMDAAISILKEGVNEFGPRFPDRCVAEEGKWGEKGAGLAKGGGMQGGGGGCLDRCAAEERGDCLCAVYGHRVREGGGRGRFVSGGNAGECLLSIMCCAASSFLLPPCVAPCPPYSPVLMPPPLPSPTQCRGGGAAQPGGTAALHAGQGGGGGDPRPGKYEMCGRRREGTGRRSPGAGEGILGEIGASRPILAVVSALGPAGNLPSCCPHASFIPSPSSSSSPHRWLWK